MRIVLLILTFCNSLSLSAQVQRGYNWITGYSGNKISFNGSSVNTLQGAYFPTKYFQGGNSCISDSNGSLILASDGLNIYDGSGQFIQNGDTLSELSYFQWQDGWSNESQTSIFLPMDDELYYFVTPIFSDSGWSNCTSNNKCYFDQLLYSIVDMKASGGQGKVIKRMQPLIQNGRLRKTQMMACRHGNGKDWWLLKNEGDSANVHTFLFTQDSVYDKGIQSFAEPLWGEWDLRGQSTFNNDGSLFASTSSGGGSLTSLGLVFVADFDRCYGILSNPRVLEMPLGSMHNPNDTTLMDKQSTGLCFSSNSRFLYVVSHANVYQFDFMDSSWFHVAGLDTSAQKFQEYETMYMGSDSKIYIGNFHGLSKQMSRIDNPDVKGVGCNFCPRCLRLDSLGANAYVGTPPCMPNYGLGSKTCWPLQSVEPTAIEEDWCFYPNPVFQDIIIKNAKGKRKMLFDALGQVLLSTNKDEIDVSKYPRGLYYIRCDNKSKKVIIE